MHFEPKLLHVIILMANAYLEYTCINPWVEPLCRTWVYRRTVDLSGVVLQ
jgi:hypothetical protein